jgi:hypothetical protein
VVNRRKPFNAAEDDVFRGTGAYVLYRYPPSQVRFRKALQHTASQAQRKQWLQTLESGHPVDAVDWVLTPGDMPIPAFGDPAAHCRAGTRHRPLELILYRTR